MSDKKTPEQMAEELADSLYLRKFEKASWDDVRNAYLAGYESARPKWISVKERLPEPDTFVLAYRWTTGEWVRAECIKRCDGGRRWLFRGTEFFPGWDNISCWFEVPLVPKEAE